jgi:hypothetical protein
VATRFPLARPLLLASLVATVASLALAQAEVYKSRDAQGNVIFSDKSSGSAEAVKLPPTNTMPEVAPPTRPAAPRATGDAASAGYALAIVTPVEGQMVFSATGTLDVGVSVAPALQPEHSLRLLLDGAPAGIPPQAGSITLEGVSQGTHTLELQVLDGNGELVQSSGTVSVHLQRPGRPRRPG